MVLQHGVYDGVLGRLRVELEADGLASIEQGLDLFEVQCFRLLHGDSHRPQLLWRLPLPVSTPGSSCVGINVSFRLILYWTRRLAAFYS